MSPLEQLNERQREAVLHDDGPLLVLAGAGSGKTRVLTHRLARLLADGLASPDQVTAVTFTNKAAREMEQRVATLVGGRPSGTFVGTFHRWALDLLRRYPAEAGLPQRFVILDTDDQRALVDGAERDVGVDTKMFPPRRVLGWISAASNEGRSPEDLERRGAGGERTAEVWRRYRQLKRRAGAIDFDDMLVLALELIRRSAGARRRVKHGARFLLVDEFQDTNRLQLDLVREAVGSEGNITAVGDEDQSIYRWRGARVDNILSFEAHFPGARVVSLEQNYRSSQAILRAAGELIARNRSRRGKRLFTDVDGGEPVRLHVAADDRGEASWVADHTEELIRRWSAGEVAVLMRTNAQTRPFEEELTRRGVAYRVVGGLRFWQRAVVKDALAYLRLVVNENDEVAFRRVVNVPARGVGAVTLDVLERAATTSGGPLPAAARTLPEGLTPRAEKALREFFELLESARAQRDTMAPGDFVGWLLERSGMLDLYGGDDPDKVARRENLRELAAAVDEAGDRGQDLEQFLDAVSLLEESDDPTAEDAVNLMTLHSAKGLEFHAVFLVGLEEGLLPHVNATEPEAIEEERRLAYVGMTRARNWLALTAARQRFLHGSRRTARLSPFLLELPSEVYEDLSARPAVVPTSPAGGGPAGDRRSPRHGRRSSGSGRPIGSTVTDAHGTGWRPGDRVRHERFGSGLVLACRGRGSQLKLVVFFDRHGKKTLLPTIAKLEKA